jgi:hypothetical protein
MSLTVAELSEEVRDTNRRLTDAVQKLADSVQRLEVRTAVIEDRLGSIRKIGWTLAMTAIGLLGSAFFVVHRAAQIEGAVVTLQGNFAEFKTDFKARDKQIADSLDRIEKTLAQIRPANSALK